MPDMPMLIYTQAGEVFEVKLEGDVSTSIGRHRAAELWIDDSTVDRQHARIDLRDDGCWMLSDEDSSKGTFLNGDPVTLAPLEDGDEVRCGNVAFTVRLPELVEQCGCCGFCSRIGPVGKLCDHQRCRLWELHFIPRNQAYMLLKDKTPPRAPVGRYIGDWLVTGYIGGGAFGDVYRAQRMPGGFPGALKILNTQSEQVPISLEKFRGEAKALKQIDHPNVVGLHDYGEDNGRLFLVMKYLQEAKNLQELLDTEGMPLSQAITIIKQAAAGLAAAHEKKQIHRDIKPENIMVQRLPGGSLHVTLVDFGLAKDVGRRVETRLIAGTATYMAPEQLHIQGPATIGNQTDWYAMGVLTFRLLFGSQLFKNLSLETQDKREEAYRLKIQNPAIEILRRRNAGPATINFFAWALNPDFNRRIQSYSDFIDALTKAYEELLTDHSPQPPVPNPSPISKIEWYQYRRLWILVGLFLMVSLVIALLLMTGKKPPRTNEPVRQMVGASVQMNEEKVGVTPTHQRNEALHREAKVIHEQDPVISESRGKAAAMNPSTPIAPSTIASPAPDSTVVPSVPPSQASHQPVEPERRKSVERSSGTAADETQPDQKTHPPLHPRHTGEQRARSGVARRSRSKSRQKQSRRRQKATKKTPIKMKSQPTQNPNDLFIGIE